MDNDFAEIIFVIGAIVLTIVFFKYFLIALGIIIAIIGIFALSKYIKRKNRRNQMVSDNVFKGNIEDYIKQIKTKIQNLRRYYYKLKDEDMRTLLDNVTVGMKKIVSILKEDPRDYKAIRRFLNITIDSTDKILSQSAQLYSIENPSDNTLEGLKNAKEGLNLLSSAINNQINKLYDNNAMDLDIEVKVLKNVLGAKGLISELDKENVDD